MGRRRGARGGGGDPPCTQLSSGPATRAPPGQGWHGHLLPEGDAGVHGSARGFWHARGITAVWTRRPAAWLPSPSLHARPCRGRMAGATL
eukprot:3690647-Alexandrium_andersonii.AAC.1